MSDFTAEELRVGKMILERNAALRSLNEKKIRRYAKRWGAEVPADDLTFWAAVHKARCECEAMTPEEKQLSADGLIERGMYPGINPNWKP